MEKAIHHFLTMSSDLEVLILTSSHLAKNSTGALQTSFTYKYFGPPVLSYF